MTEKKMKFYSFHLKKIIGFSNEKKIFFNKFVNKKNHIKTCSNLIKNIEKNCILKIKIIPNAILSLYSYILIFHNDLFNTKNQSKLW